MANGEAQDHPAQVSQSQPAMGGIAESPDPGVDHFFIIWGFTAANHTSPGPAWHAVVEWEDLLPGLRRGSRGKLNYAMLKRYKGQGLRVEEETVSRRPVGCDVRVVLRQSEFLGKCTKELLIQFRDGVRGDVE